MNSKFDNTYTLKYKKVEELETPVKYIIYDDGNFIPIFDLIQSDIDISLKDLYNRYGSEFGIRDFMNVYFYSLDGFKPREEILDIINDFIDLYNEDLSVEAKSKKQFDRYATFEEFEDVYNRWAVDYNKQLQFDKRQLTTIINVQKKLEEYEPQNIQAIGKNPIVESASYILEPEIEIASDGGFGKAKFQRVTKYIESSLIIFNDMKASFRVPFVQLNYGNQKYFKVYESDTFRNIKELFNYISNDRENTFYFLVLNNLQQVESLTQSSYTLVKYSLSTNRITFSSEIGQRDVILRNLQVCFRGFIFLSNKVKQYNLYGKMMIKNFSIDESCLYFLFWNEHEVGLEEGVISTYFFIDESDDHTLAERTYIKIKYQDLTDEEPEVQSTVRNSSSLTVTLKPEDKDIIVEFSKAANEKILNQFKEIFGRVLTIYKMLESELQTFLNGVVPIETNTELSTRKGRRVITKDIFEKKFKQLRAEADELTPGLFDKNKVGYTRRCDCKKQPIIVSDKEADLWKDRVFTVKGETLPRQIGEFPPNSSKFLYVCPSDEYPFPTVIENQNPDTSKVYPYVPCCAETDNINNSNSKYNNYDKTKEPGKTNRNYEISTMKKLDYSRIGDIPSIIQDLLNTENVEPFKFKRFGIGQSINALIHCVMKAINDVNYVGFLNMEDKEKYCQNVRDNIQELLPHYHQVVSQECYDYTPGMIDREIKNKKEFFDSSKYYRILEELFQVNIFVFMVSRENKTEETILEVPKHMLTHIRNFRDDRKSIIVIKHMGGELESLPYPQYDLIFNTQELQETKKSVSDVKPIYLFDSQITSLMFKALKLYNSNFVFNIEGENIESRFSPFSEVNWIKIFEDFELESQNIDSYGKLRSLNLKFRDIFLTVYMPPFQPLNLPISDKVYKTEYTTILEIFGQPYSEIATGLWYSIIDFNHGVFIPCNTDSTETKPVDPVPIKSSIKDNQIQIFREAEKYSKMLLQLIEWGLRSNKILNLSDYLSKKDLYLVEDTNVLSNTKPIKLISYVTEKGDFNYLNSIWPEYFKGNRVHLYPSLYNKVVQFFERRYTETDGLSLAPNPYLNGVFEYEWDFISYPSNRVLIGYKNISLWLDIRSRNFNNEVQISTELTSNLFANPEPFLYHDISGGDKRRMYLIQKVRDGNFNRALECGNQWRLNRYNPGYDAELINREFIPHIIYSVTSGNNIDIESENDYQIGRGEKSFVMVLRVDFNYYAAMLQLF